MSFDFFWQCPAWGDNWGRGQTPGVTAPCAIARFGHTAGVIPNDNSYISVLLLVPRQRGGRSVHIFKWVPWIVVSTDKEAPEEYLVVKQQGGPAWWQSQCLLALARDTHHTPYRKHTLWLLFHRQTPSSISMDYKSELAHFCDPLRAARTWTGTLASSVTLKHSPVMFGCAVHCGKSPVSKERAVCYASSEGDGAEGEPTPHQLCFSQENDSSPFSPHKAGNLGRVISCRVLERTAAQHTLQMDRNSTSQRHSAAAFVAQLRNTRPGCLWFCDSTKVQSQEQWQRVTSGSSWTFSGALHSERWSKFPADQSSQTTAKNFRQNIKKVKYTQSLESQQKQPDVRQDLKLGRRNQRRVSSLFCCTFVLRMGLSHGVTQLKELRENLPSF